MEKKHKYIGFPKLEAMLKDKGAKNPAAVAAKIGMAKYGKKEFLKHAHAGKSMKHVKPKK